MKRRSITPHRPLPRLAVRQPWVGLLASGEKIWELRGSPISLRGRVGLIEQGSGCIVAGATLVDCHGPLTAEQLRDSEDRHRVAAANLSQIAYSKTYAWCARVQMCVMHALLPRPSSWPSALCVNLKLKPLPSREFADATPLVTPVPYTHTRGAVIWVKLSPAVDC